MKAAADTRRERVRAMLADLKMPDALEVVDEIFAQADYGTVTATEAIEQLRTITTLNGAFCRPLQRPQRVIADARTARTGAQPVHARR